MGISPLSSPRYSSTKSATKPTLRPGSKGAAVTALQKNLHKHGYGAKVGRADGDFGPKTKSAVTAFQNDRITDLGGRIKNASTDNEAIRLSQLRNGLVKERDAGVAGDVTQTQLAAAPKARAPAPATSGAPTPNLPPREATTAVGGDPSIAAPASQPTGAPTTVPQTTSGLSNQSYTVKSGDTMGKIARDKNVTLGALTQANPQVTDPNKIFVGQKLNVPTKKAPASSPSPSEIDSRSGVSYDDPTPKSSAPAIDRPKGEPTASVYTVKSGDTMGGIAKNHDVTLGALTQANPQVTDPNKISVGQKLSIPGQATPKTAPTTPANAPVPSALDVSKRKADGLESNFRAAQEHGREPDLSTAKQNLATHLEGDYIPKLQTRQSSLAQQQFRATEHGQDTTKVNAQRKANAAELTRANGLLDEAKGAPIAATDPGVLTLPAGLTPGQTPHSFDATVVQGGMEMNVNVQASNVSQPEQGGARTRTLDVTQTTTTGSVHGADVGPVGAEGGVFDGQAMSYQVTMPEAHYQKVLAGTAPLPNPGDISTMPNNSSAMIRSEAVSGVGAEGSIGAFGIGADRSTSSGNVVGMQVDGKGDVRVMAGPTDAVTHGDTFLAGKTIGVKGFEIGAEVSAGNSTTLRNTELSFVDLDRDSGQQAFNQFMASGEVPSASATGVLSGGNIKQYDATQEARLGASVVIGDSDFGASFKANGENAQYTDVQLNNGTSAQSLTIDTHESRMYATATKDAGGHITSQNKGIIFDTVDASVREGAAAAFGKRAGPTGTMQWEMTEAEYAQARQMVSERYDTPLGQTRGFSNLSDAFLANATYDEFISDARLRALDSGTFGNDVQTLAPAGQTLPGTLVVS